MMIDIIAGVLIVTLTCIAIGIGYLLWDTRNDGVWP